MHFHLTYCIVTVKEQKAVTGTVFLPYLLLKGAYKYLKGTFCYLKCSY